MKRAYFPKHRFDGDAYVLKQFDLNVGVFSKSWELKAPLSNHLRTFLVADLSKDELGEMYNILYCGWEPMEVSFLCGFPFVNLPRIAMAELLLVVGNSKSTQVICLRSFI